jgi:hypothetical protein
MPTKKLLVFSDPHCGHLCGLTPSRWNPRSDRDNEAADYRDVLYSWTQKEIAAFGKVDVAVLNGDAVDGTGRRSGGTEQITTDTNEQAFMCVDWMKTVRTKAWFMTYGTPYHTGDQNDIEDVIAREMGCEIAGTMDLSLNGRVFNFKHKIGGSQIPHGRATSVLRDKMWNQLWALRGEYPMADVVIRSHVHAAIAVDAPDGIAMITPALQGYGSKYGTRQVSGTVDFGLTYFEITDKGGISWTRRILRMPYRPPIEA